MLLSIGDQVKPGTYRPHSRFHRVVNFEREGRLVSVVDERIGPGPLNIVLHDLRFAQARHHAEPAVSFPKGLLQIGTRTVLFAVYVICGFCAAVAGIVSLSQAPTVSPGFGNNREFMAIAAAVLGGTSLFGGRGAVLPGTVLGAVLIQTIENGLNILSVNPYLYPLITSGVIFVAVLLDAVRSRILARVNRRRIFVEPEAA